MLASSIFADFTIVRLVGYISSHTDRKQCMAVIAPFKVKTFAHALSLTLFLGNFS